jgi:primosomal protein N' (replication factor Y)
VVNIARGRYERVSLPRRHAEATLPLIALVDMRQERIEPGRFLAPPLALALGQTLSAGEQSLLFLNRRGYAPLTLCRACGHRIDCPNCAASLVEHRFRKQLMCHHCGHTEAIPPQCPKCATPISYAAARSPAAGCSRLYPPCFSRNRVTSAAASSVPRFMCLP